VTFLSAKTQLYFDNRVCALRHTKSGTYI